MWVPVCGHPAPPALRLWRKKAGPSSPTSSLSAGEVGRARRSPHLPLGVASPWPGLSLAFHSSESGPRCSSPVDTGHGGAQDSLTQGPERTRE